MKVILNQDVKDLGKKGELVNVSDGYAKNFLIPRKVAVIADNTAMNELKNREASKAHHLAVEKAEAQAAAQGANPDMGTANDDPNVVDADFKEV